MFDNYLVRKQVVLDYKILILNSGHIGFSQRGQPMILVKKWKFYLCMFLDKWALKYCLMIIEVENKPSQTIKIWILHSCHTEIFLSNVLFVLTITKLFFHATNHYACINCCPQSVSQSAMQLVRQSASQSVSQSISQSVSQSVSQ